METPENMRTLRANLSMDERAEVGGCVADSS